MTKIENRSWWQSSLYELIFRVELSPNSNSKRVLCCGGVNQILAQLFEALAFAL